MDELISRQAAIDAMLGDKVEITNVIRALGNERDFEVLNCTCDRHAEIIKDLPPVQPEIIRCKECRYYEWMSNRVPDEQTWFCHNWNAETGKDDYCSYAERREE